MGCVLSPLIFNLFIDGLPIEYDDQCDPVMMNNNKVQALMFADDVIVLSQSARGLQRAITITVNYFTSISLTVKFTKSQVMVFNVRSVLLDKDADHVFSAGGQNLKVVREYNYLGIKLTPSGVASHGATELFLKARRSWFSMSNLVYKH